MSDLALSKIGGLIKAPEDLSKLDDIRQQFAKEKSTVDIKLSTTTDSQIASINHNLAELNRTISRVEEIKADISKFHNTYDESVTSVKDYDLIRKMISINQFMEQVTSLTQDIRQFRKNLERLNREIADETAMLKEDLRYPVPNILIIHYRYTRVRNFADYLEKYSQSLSDDLQSLVYGFTSPVRETIRLFDELLNECIISITEAVKDDNFEMLYKVVGIVLWEDKEDTKISVMQNLDLVRHNVNKDYNDFRSKRRNYKKFFFDKFKLFFEDTFNSCVEHYQYEKIGLYGDLQWLEEELTFVYKYLSPLLPKDWQFGAFTEKIFYDKLHQYTMDMINLEPPAEDILQILSYDKKFADYSKQLEGSAKSIIGADLKETVLDDYLRNITNKMNEWNDSLIKQETTYFSERLKAPDIYPYDQTVEEVDNNNVPFELSVNISAFVLPDFKTPLNMLKQQADVAAESGYSKILVAVIENWCNAYIARVENFQVVVDEEMDRYFTVFSNEKFLIKESKMKRLFKKRPTVVNIDELSPEEQANISRPGIVEYFGALANSFEISGESITSRFVDTYKEKVHTNYHVKISQAFESAVASSNSLNSDVCIAISNIIINDLYVEMCKLFTKQWLEDGMKQTGDAMSAAIMSETIAEYLSELRSYCVYTIYQNLCQIFLDKFVCAYIKIGFENILYGDGKKINPETQGYKSFASRVGKDAELIFGGLQDLFTDKDRQYLLSTVSAIEILGDLGTSPNPMETFPSIWEHHILPVFYNCSTDYIKAVVYSRKDMDKNQWKILEPVLKDIKARYHEKVAPPESPVLTLDDFEFNV
ncbi:SEC6 [Candida theae]|uniref:SEC6 n=1 Tax=Candida theae TaxID=1198502 RepID=A0AAD5G0Y2_9ASCO|nr:SEC6 [Candida theae]KAI5968415.1 SEC6 [Candida theae]